MLSTTKILLEQAINRLHEAKINEIEEHTKDEVQRIIYKIQHLIESNK